MLDFHPLATDTQSAYVSEHSRIKLAFRQKNMSTFSQFKEALISTVAQLHEGATGGPMTSSAPGQPKKRGIGAIIDKRQSEIRQDQATLEHATTDLKSLMSSAEQMVTKAQ